MDERWPSVDADYADLLRRGFVRRALPEPYQDLWRSQMRRKAQQDRLRIRTGAFTTPPPLVWARLEDWRVTYEELAEAMEGMSWWGEGEDE